MIIYSELLGYPTPKGQLRIRPGYVYIKKVNSMELKFTESREGIVHGKLFMSLFYTEPSKLNDLITSGFSRKNGEWKFNSSTLNTQNK